ncbi:hypothetical protein BGZ65_000474 [Modicella reniformis]|uniref:Secreted protein n=1 Tax=Modicella reniformis TaxID=1440133 RepID=A0A9P6IMD0_9FUNG|nr:hypothetical protein BGZ65_000474 [Modicella reniformis]
MISRTALCALVAALALALLTVTTDAHSWVECSDWRPNNKNKPAWGEKDGKCFGYARRFPITQKVKFGGRDSRDEDKGIYNRHFDQGRGNNAPPCSNRKNGAEKGDDETRGKKSVGDAYGGKYGPMATTSAGETMCVRWPAKTHNDSDDHKVMINMQKTETKEDPSQKELDGLNIAELAFSNCNGLQKDNEKNDNSPCGGCFNIRKDQKPGTYMVQWQWRLNDEMYTSCYDVKVLAK